MADLDKFVSMSKRVAFHTLGCKLNYSETSALAGQFRDKGYEVVPLGMDTDLIVVNTCTVTENADTECRKIIRRGLKGAPDAAVVVTGCYAQLQPEEIASIDGVRAVFGTAEKSQIADRVEEILTLQTPRVFTTEFTDETSFVGATTAEGDSRTRAFVKLQTRSRRPLTGLSETASMRSSSPASTWANTKPPPESVLWTWCELSIRWLHR